MRRNRLKNIINKSKGLSNKQQLVGESPFEQFKNSLPEELESFKGDNYRLEAAWKAYGSPKNYEEAVWLGLVNPQIPGKMPSIGYNEESDEYEYLNTGKENDIVAKDIRVWDNDVIPLVKELKLGGYVRTFNEEKNCWTYSKNPQKGIEPSENNEQQVIDYYKSGKKVKKIKSDKAYFDPETNTIYYTDKESLKHEQFHSNPDEKLLESLKPYYDNLDDNRIIELGGDLDYVKRFEGDPNHFYNPEELGARISAARYRTRKVPEYNIEFFKNLRKNENMYGDNMRDLLHMYNDENLYKIFSQFNPSKGGGFGAMIYQDPNGEIADGKPLKATGKFNEDGQELYEDENGDLYTLDPQMFKQGGQMNVIPEGALHARKNNMELAKEGEVTHKGIPVVDNQGEQQAEIERNEIIFTKETTDKIEGYYKKFKDDYTSTSEKDELAIKCGKFLVDQILNNTDDKTGLIEEVKQNI